MGRQIKAALYRLFFSPVDLLLLLIGILFCVGASNSADMKSISDLSKALASDPDSLARLQNLYGVQAVTAEGIFEEYFRMANLPLVFSLANGSAYTFNIFLCAVFLGRDLHRARLQGELLACGRGRTLTVRLLLIHLCSIIFHAAVFLWGADRYLVLSDHSPALLLPVLLCCILISAANASFLVCIYMLFRSAILGGVTSAAAEVLIMRLSLIIPLSPARFMFTSFRTGADMDVLSAAMGPYALWAAGYLILFTVISFVLFRRKELR